MNKDTLHTALRYALIGIIIVSLALLGWWYFFLKKETASQEFVDTARGINVRVPEFSSSEGSTYLNLVESLPSVPLWRAASERLGAAVRPLISFEQEEEKRVRLWHASALPVAGMGFVNGHGTTTLRFVERATGNILEADLEKQVVTRLTNTLIPEVQEALFAGERVFLRYAENGIITTKTGVAKRSSDPQSFPSENLEEKIISLAISPSEREIAYLVPESQGGAILYSADAGGKNKRRIVALGTREWNVRYTNQKIFVLVERPADDVVGHAYSVSSAGVRTPILPSTPGLSVAPHASSSAILYSTSEKGALALYARPNEDGAPISLQLKTTADKCAFAPGGKTAYCAVPRGTIDREFLGRWYRGETHTSDAWWEIDIEHGAVKQIIDPEIEAGFLIDVEVPRVSDDGLYLTFRDAQDWSLWVLTIR